MAKPKMGKHQAKMESDGQGGQKMKFRAWDNENNKYFEPTYMAYVGEVEDLQIGLNGRLSLRTMYEFIDESLFPGRFIVEPYTGLKDCKRTEEYPDGQEIYKGDIVVFKNVFSKDNHVGEVRYYSGCKPISDDGNHSVDLAETNNEDLEVIGNIRENPELLEVPNEKNT